jgi:hypothetical protein
VSLWCSGGQGHSTSNIHGAQMMIIRLDGFF